MADFDIDLARQRFKLGQEADNKQRQRENADLEFLLDPWPPEIKKAREGQGSSGGMPPIPARPCLNIDTISDQIRQILNQERQTDMGVELVPADDFAALGVEEPDEEIELREGLIRRIQRDPVAADARTWAFDRAVKAGRGYYGVTAKYAEGKSYDQDIKYLRFYNQGAVTLDPAHEQPDGSDAEWGFVGAWIPWSDYKAQWPKMGERRNALATMDTSEFISAAEKTPEWFHCDGDLRAVHVADYYYTVKTSRELALMPDGSAQWVDELPEGVTPVDTRKVIQKSIKWAKIDGFNDAPLEETDWQGPDIPIVKVLGVELQPFDADRRVQGMVRPVKDSAMAFNFMISKLVEVQGLTPIAPYQVAEGQIETYEAWYAAANTRTLPYLPYKTRDLEGNVVGAPPRNELTTPIAPLAQSAQIFRELIQSISGVHDPSVGKTDPSLKSGKAIQLTIDQDQQSTSNYLDNLKRSIRYEGQILNNLLYPIYGKRPGRLARIINGQGEAETVTIGQPPAASPAQPGAGAPAVPQQRSVQQKSYTLTKDANFNVVVKATKSYDTRREQENSIVGQLLGAEPMLMTWFGDLFFKNQDGPGHQEMAERAKVMLDPKILAMIQAKAKGDGQPQDPQVQQLQAQLQQAQQGMQQLQQEAQAETAKYHAQMQIEQLKGQQTQQIEQMKVQSSAQLQITLRQMDNAAKLEAARIAAAKQSADLQAEMLEERIALHAEQGHDVGMAAMDHEHTLAQGQQAAALAPPPMAPNGNGAPV